MKNISDIQEFERCIMCGTLTSVPTSMPIDWRENYEIGFGQLCVECANKQRKTSEQQNIAIRRQIILAAEQNKEDDEK